MGQSTPRGLGPQESSKGLTMEGSSIIKNKKFQLKVNDLLTIRGNFTQSLVINTMNNNPETMNDIGKTCLCFTLRIQWMTLNTPAMSQVNIIRHNISPVLSVA